MDTENTAIVLFSKDGNTRLAAKLLGDRVHGRIIELVEKKKGNPFQAFLKLSSRLAGEPWREIERCDKVYLMTPIWANGSVPAMNAFLKNADFAGKTVCIITVQGLSNLRASAKIHSRIGGIVEQTGGKLTAKYAFVGSTIGQCAEEYAMRMQIDKVKPI